VLFSALTIKGAMQSINKIMNPTFRFHFFIIKLPPLNKENSLSVSFFKKRNMLTGTNCFIHDKYKKIEQHKRLPVYYFQS
jgi:hypothetical protein